MESIQWFLMGVLSTLCVFGFSYLSVKVKAPWYAWTVFIVGAIGALFGLAWAGSSFNEGVPASGAMGLMVFTLPSLVVMTLAWRFWVAPGLKAH
jgi:hypothetical protein